MARCTTTCLDTKTHTTLRDFGSIAATIVGKYIRVAARYHVHGTLVAVRLWASSSFNSVWISPEGHLLHVDTGTNTLVVDNEEGIGVPLSHFTYTRNFLNTGDDYTLTLPYISPSTTNGSDPQSGNAITGFKWWNFTFATVVDSGTNAVNDFVSATNAAVNFGGSVGVMKVTGETWATWNDPASPDSWAAPSAVLTPTTVPLGLAATGYNSGSFAIGVPGGTTTVPVNLSTTSGSATLVYQVDWTNGILTISPVDIITTTTGQTTSSTNLVANTPVKVFGIPQADGSITCYVLSYFTGFAQATTN